jgi:hypothetical protein
MEKHVKRLDELWAQAQENWTWAIRNKDPYSGMVMMMSVASEMHIVADNMRGRTPEIIDLTLLDDE